MSHDSLNSTREENASRAREGCQDALIVKLFNKGVGYMQLKKRPKTKRALKGDFFLIDIGFNYYVTRFTNREDYERVLMDLSLIHI